MMPPPPPICLPALPPPAADTSQDEAEREAAEAEAAELQAGPKPLEVLYNDYAIPSKVRLYCCHGTAMVLLWQCVVLLRWGWMVHLAHSCLPLPTPTFLPFLPSTPAPLHPQNWLLCLEMVHLAHFSDQQYVCQLWDLALKEVRAGLGWAGWTTGWVTGWVRFMGTLGPLDDSCETWR